MQQHGSTSDPGVISPRAYPPWATTVTRLLTSSRSPSGNSSRIACQISRTDRSTAVVRRRHSVKPSSPAACCTLMSSAASLSSNVASSTESEEPPRGRTCNWFAHDGCQGHQQRVPVCLPFELIQTGDLPDGSNIQLHWLVLLFPDDPPT